MKKLKWILTGLAAVVVAVVVAVYAVLSSMDFEEFRGLIEAEAKDATGRELKIAGAIDLKLSLNPAIALERVTLANAAWGSRPEMISIQRLEVEVALMPLISGDIVVNRLVVVEPDILVETNAKGQGNWEMAAAKETKEAEEPEEGAAALPSFDRVVIRGGRLVYRNGQTGEEIRLDLDELNGRAAGRGSPLELAIKGRYNGSPFKVDGVFGSFGQLLDGEEFPVKVSAEAGGATLEAEGRIADPMAGKGINLRISARGDSLAELGVAAGADLPPLGPYSISAEIAEAGKAYKITGLAVKLGSSDLAGNMTLSLAGKRPSLKGGFTAGVLDLEDFAAPGEAAAAPAPAGESKFVFIEDPLPLDGLKTVDAEVKLSAGVLRLRDKMELADVEISVKLKAGRLQVEPLSVGFAGGRITASLSLDAGKKTPPVSLGLSARGIDYGGLLKDLDVTDGVVGSLDANAQLGGAGASPRAIASSLSGRVEVIGGEGKIANDLLRTTGAGLLEMFSAWREGDDDLALNCVVVRLPVKGGVMKSEAILLDTAAATVGVDGTIDLRNEELNLRVSPQAKQTSLMSLAVPVRVGGTLKSPSVGPDPVGTVIGAAKIAGLVINPLAAGALLIVESETADQNPCVAALESKGAEAAPAPSNVIEGAAQGVAEGVGQVGEGVGEVLEGVGEGITKGLKGLFGD